jgi:hypothetical protein
MAFVLIAPAPQAGNPNTSTPEPLFGFRAAQRYDAPEADTWFELNTFVARIAQNRGQDCAEFDYRPQPIAPRIKSAPSVRTVQPRQ